MKNIITIENFDFDYFGSKHNEISIIENGFKLLTGEELHDKIVNKKVYGDYPLGYKFISVIYEDGTTEGLNNVGTRDFGQWTINFEDNTLILKWRNSWLDTITRAYEVNHYIEFFDIDTGNWRTTFRRIIMLNE